MISLAVAARFSELNIESIDTKLHEAAYKGELNEVKYTLSRLSAVSIQSLVDKRNHLGCTALRLAATAGHADCVKYLLSIGASVDVADIKAQTPLFVAVKNNNVECTKILLEYGADPEGDSSNMSTPLYIAALNNSKEIVKLLIRYGVCLSAFHRPLRVTRTFRNDALEGALAYQHYDCCKTLLVAGYVPFPQSLYYITARYKCALIMLELLYEFGYNVIETDTERDQLNRIETVDQSEKLIYLKRLLATPRSLLSLSRLVIRRNLNDVNRVHELELPRSLLGYLEYE